MEEVIFMREENAYFQQFTTEQLETILRLSLAHSRQETEAVLLQVMEVLKEREKNKGTLPDVDKAWEEFQTYYNTPEMRGVELYGDKEELDRLLEEDLRAQEQEREARKEKVVSIRAGGVLRRLSKIAVIALVTLGVAFSSITVAQAAGIDFYGIMGTWTNNVFKFRVSENTPTSEQERASEEIQAELNAMGVYQDLAPTWWPEGFEVYELKPEHVEGEFDSVVCGYENKETNEFFSVIFDIYYNAYWFSTPYEKDDTPMEVYESNGRSFYIMSNIDTLTATWSDGSLVVTIGGQLTRDEIKGIIDSIGG